MRKNNVLWVSLLFLASFSLAADAPQPQKKKMSLQDLLGTTGKPSETPTAVAGVRGLQETGSEIDTKARDYASIERLEQVVIHDDEVTRFIDEGKLR